MSKKEIYRRHPENSRNSQLYPHNRFNFTAFDKIDIGAAVVITRLADQLPDTTRVVLGPAGIVQIVAGHVHIGMLAAAAGLAPACRAAGRGVCRRLARYVGGNRELGHLRLEGLDA